LHRPELRLCRHRVVPRRRNLGFLAQLLAHSDGTAVESTPPKNQKIPGRSRALFRNAAPSRWATLAQNPSRLTDHAGLLTSVMSRALTIITT
jgi:hypothetical protein